ncbi:predicted protein [Lichtheimia corymbifera JMRC:FSU:9682]|uniref:Choice-of-anchor A domain-containing protein n=1 Tax=Lichtheimia corymbifera JMRC:FSU:9682 TaxID=1263082 RepID=A0A068RH99_9FUNG|nr:predicted protein [Lichtheimia corymbifera JMRC:FSU:9682]
MKAPILAALLLLAQGQYAAALNPVRQQDVQHECPLSKSGNNQLSSILSHFSGIFLGDYTSNGGFFPGPLAIGGDYHTNTTMLDSSRHVDCTASSITNNNVLSYGLVVNGNLYSNRIDLTGNAFIGKGDDNIAGSVKPQPQGGFCDQMHFGNSPLDFDAVESSLRRASEALAMLKPDMRFKEQLITQLDTPENPLYNVFTFDTCRDCSFWVQESLSDPSGLLFSGPAGSLKETPSGTVVLNIPVADGSTLIIDADMPTYGFNPCNTIFNFYPVSEDDGQYLLDGEFTIDRRTVGQLEGLILAPRGHIREASHGNFAGAIYALDYTSVQPHGGAGLRDFFSTTGACAAYSGCFPIAEQLKSPSQLEKRQDDDAAETSTTTTTLTITPESITNTETQILTETIEITSNHEVVSTATLLYTTVRTHTDRSTYTDFNTIFSTPTPVTSTHEVWTTETVVGTEPEVHYVTVYVRPEGDGWLPGEDNDGHYRHKHHDHHHKHKDYYKKGDHGHHKHKYHYEMGVYE